MFWNHTPRMIEAVRNRGVQWPSLNEKDLTNVISYIYYVKFFDEPGDPDQGERWFRDKGCIQCHAVGGKGSDVARALDDYARYVAPIALAEGMWNNGPAMQTTQMARGVPIPTFDGREIADIQAFIRRDSRLADRNVVLFPPPDPNQGRELYLSKGCVSCHGPAGRGTTFGPDLRAAIQQLRVSEIAGKLWNHSFRMSGAMQSRGIAFPHFEGSEMADVIAYLYYLRFYDEEGDAKAGELAFWRKGCSGCHMGDGKPARIGPDLTHSSAATTPLGLATAMWNHAPAMYDRAQIQDVQWPRFEGDEMRDLAAYLRQIAAGRDTTP
jgi:mono/diheme cytochrome c family protein